MTKKRVWAAALTVLAAISLFPVTSFAAPQNVAEVEGIGYETLQKAIEAAPEGSTVTLLSDVTENVNFNKNITVDGAGKYTVAGLSSVSAGTLQNLTLKPNDTDAKGRLLTLGNAGANTSIALENITVHYSVTKRDAGSAMTVSGNKAAIKIDQCHFINTPNNQGAVENALEWSYGLYINGQDNSGSILFTNSEFSGAFRTMLPNVSGNFIIENCTFTNSVYTVLNGPTGGAGATSTSITTSASANNQIQVRSNYFDNAGSIYLQTQADFTGNTIKNDVFEHYIQAGDRIGEPVDFKSNTFELGSNHLLIYDVAAAPVILPAGQVAVNGWVWMDTPEDIKPADYNDYTYMYNEDETITFIPQSSVALAQFFGQAGSGNIQVDDQDTVLIDKDLTLDQIVIEKGKNIIFQIAEDAILEVTGNWDIKGSVTVEGNGKLKINDQGKVTISPDAALEVTPDTKLENNGEFSNSGELTIPDSMTGNGTITGSGTVEKLYTVKHVSATAPTCDKDGNIEYWYCAVCNKYYTDAALTQECTKEGTIKKALGHTYKNGKCTVCGKKDLNYKPADPDSSLTDNKKDPASADSGIPQTGDNRNVGILLALMLTAAFSFFGIAAYKKIQ